jgi:hypothetical protein
MEMSDAKADSINRFADKLEACMQRLTPKKTMFEMQALRALVKVDPDATKAFIEYYCELAGEHPQCIDLARLVAGAYDLEFGDRGPLDTVYARADQLRARIQES